MRNVALEDGLKKADNVVQTLNSATGIEDLSIAYGILD